MKYNEPYGSTDPNAGYIDRNTPGAVAGSRVPAAAIEHPQREIMAVITAAGLEPSKTDLTQLLKAIQQIVNAATGGAGDANYVLMTQARVRLPIFPDVLTSDGTLAVISPSNGIVRIMPGYEFLHRGIFNVTTVQQDFVTSASKTYHLRWNPSDGFSLKDISSAVYNPSGLSEENAAFDTTFDDMLIARIKTNSSNVAVVTPLSNKAVLGVQVILKQLDVSSPGTKSAIFSFKHDMAWGRTPSTFSFYPAKSLNTGDRSDADYNVGPIGSTLTQLVNNDAVYVVNRYGISQQVLADYSSVLQMHFTGRA